MGKSRMVKKVEKLEKEAEQIRRRAEQKGKQLQGQATDRLGELSGKQPKRSRKGLFTLLFSIAGAAAAFVLKKKRDQELDEALWEEPRSI